MIDGEQSVIQQVSAHRVGNKLALEELILTDAPLALEDDQLKNLLLTYFLSNFTTPAYYSFTFSNGDLSLNPLYKFATEVFANPTQLHQKSIDIAKHLYQETQHPNIKSGELYIAHITNIPLEGKYVEALGLFKSEHKDSYLKLNTDTPSFNLLAEEGVNIKKLDKGCLIFNVEQDTGYKVLVVDNANRADAQFWKENFLHIKATSDAYHQTHNFMQLTREYVSGQLDEEFSVSKADKIDLLNRSMDFFKSREEFNQAEFETEVLNDVSVIESFRKYGHEFMSNNEMEVTDNFEISVQAVKKQARIFKSVLKLDKNFHVYIHGNRELIEKGFDEVTGKHYYKIFFDQES